MSGVRKTSAPTPGCVLCDTWERSPFAKEAASSAAIASAGDVHSSLVLGFFLGTAIKTASRRAICAVHSRQLGELVETALIAEVTGRVVSFDRERARRARDAGRTFEGVPGKPDVCKGCGRPEKQHAWICEGCGVELDLYPDGSGLPILHVTADPSDTHGGATLVCNVEALS